MKILSNLSEGAIRRQATAESFERGWDYYRGGAVRALIQRGDTVYAEVEGSQYEPYEVQITLDPGGITGVDCSCPYNWGGWCKHLVAVGLALVHDPDEVEVRPALEDLVASLDRESLQALVDSPIICLDKAFVRVAMHGNECLVTLGTQGKPGWTNQGSFESSAFDYLESMTGVGGLLVHFADPFERPFEPPEPENEREITWASIHEQGVGERVLAMIKRPRERLILLLAIHQHMSPAEINGLNLSQVTQKFGRDYRPRVYLKKRLVRKKAVADALLQYRKRDRESFWGDSREPMFRTGKTTRSGRSRRMGAKAVEATIERYARRALQEMPAPASPIIKEPPVPPARPPMLWVSNIEYHRT